MKKIFSIMMIAFAMVFNVANAQTVESSKFFENTYVSLYGGAITTSHFGGQPVFWGGIKNVMDGVRPFAGLELGKYVTPVLGLSVEGLAMFNTTGSNTFVDQSNVIGNLKFNLSNWFGGYKGQPRVFEVVLVPGLGWGHDYGDVYHDRNYLTYNAGVEFNFNLGKARAWQINVKPVVMWNNYNNALTPIRSNMQGRLQFGVTYKFGSRSKKSHNFVVCPYSVRLEDYELAQNKIKELESREPIVKEVVVEKEVAKEVEVVKEVTISSVTVYFDMGKYTISDRELAHLDFYATNADKNKTIVITGSADSATGSAERNKFLAKHRALAVKDVLVNKYGFDADKVIIDVANDIFDTPMRTRVAVVE